MTLLTVLMCTTLFASAPSDRVRDRWHFKFNKFVIGAWWGPDATDAEMKAYRDAGFNVVMTGRYMQLDEYGNAEKALRELDLAHRYGLGVFFDTYTKNDRPWGGKADEYEPHPIHHPATLTELKWLYERVGRHPALAGFMIGDDQGSVSARSQACTRFLYERRPHLMPWLCGWIDPANLAANNNPIANPQIYPTLYSWGQPAEEHARQYCATYASYSRRCRENGVTFWPMFNVSGSEGKWARDMGGYMPSDSLLRFPAYAALAYGAEGIWYFIYNSGSLQHLGPHRTAEEVARALTPLYPVAQRVNRRIASWGGLVLGRTCAGVFGTAFRRPAEGPIEPADQDYGKEEDLALPSHGKLIESMDDDLIAGILTQQGRRPLVMLVNCRVSKRMNDLPERRIRIRFHPSIRRVRILEQGRITTQAGPEVSLTLEPGGGQMLELEGAGIEALAERTRIYGPLAQEQP